jgi:phage/plasmid-associated DNA primase
MNAKIAALKAKYASGNYTVQTNEETGNTSHVSQGEPTPIRKIINPLDQTPKDKQFADSDDLEALTQGMDQEQTQEEAELLATNPSIPFMVIRNALDDGRDMVYFRDDFYRRGLTHFSKVSRITIERQVMDYLKKKLRGAYTAGIIDTTIKTFEKEVGLSGDEVQARVNPPGYFNCTNGVLKFTDKGVVLLEHKAAEVQSFIFLDKPVVAYDPEASREWSDKLLICLGEKDAPSRRNMLGMVSAGMAPDLLRKVIDRIPAMLSVNKAGQNGSSVLMEIFTLLFGKSQVSRLNLREFQNADSNGCRNELYQMQGCRWNFPDENAGTGIRIDGLASLKATLTNGHVDSRNLREKSFSFKPNIVCHFPMNDTPNINYSDDSVTSRYIGISWPYIFKSKIDPNNPRHKEADLRFNLNAAGGESFVVEHVLPGLLLELVDAFYFTFKNGFDRSETLKLFRQSGANDDHVTEFLERVEAVPTHTLEDKWASENCISLDDLFNQYMLYCIDEQLVIRMEGYENRFQGYKILGNYTGSAFDQPKTDPKQLKKHLMKYHKIEFAIPGEKTMRANNLGSRKNHAHLNMSRYFNPDF